MPKTLRDNGLSLALLILFLISIVGQALAGFAHHNDEQRDHGQPEVTLTAYLSGSEFAEAVFENWESEFLQMVLFVVLTAFLYQRGSAESKDPDKSEESDEDPAEHRSDAGAPLPVKVGGWRLLLYQHSLSWALAFLFLASFVLHLMSSSRADCNAQKMHGGACSSVLSYLGNSKFWFESFQNWQSEFLSILVVVVFSIFLRHKGSPESKPVHAAHSDTGR